ncbi:MAG: ArnT family glycosyltransferase, partial [Ktedonobacterales bacterium]
MALKQIEGTAARETRPDAGTVWAARLSRLAADWSAWALLILVAGATFLHLFRLNRTSISPWDESIHAIVAQHVAQHPLQPTLFETAALVPNPPPNWALTHIWLHIPPFGIWTSALSLRLMGDTPFALRLPGVFFVGAGMLVSYVLGRLLFGRVAGLTGAAFVGFAPYFLLLSQGYVFGDLTDTPLLLLTPLAFYCLIRGYRSGRLRWLVAAGGVEGLCYLCKAGIGVLPVLGALAALYVCEWVFPAEAGWRRLGLRGVVVVLGAAAVVAGPYTLYTDIAFPAIAKQEAHNWRVAIFGNYENWGRPTDYHATIYLYAQYGAATALLLFGSVAVLALIAWRRRSRTDALVLAWILALYVPLTIAVTKAAPMTIAAAPAWGFAVARAVTVGLTARSRLWRSATLGALLGVGLLALWFLAGHGTFAGPTISARLYKAAVPPVLTGFSRLARFAPLLTALGVCALATGICWLALRLVHPPAGSPRHIGARGTLLNGRALAIAAVAVALVGVGAT